MLVKEIITVYSENHTEAIHASCGHNAKLRTTKAGGMHSYRWAKRPNCTITIWTVIMHFFALYTLWTLSKLWTTFNSHTQHFLWLCSSGDHMLLQQETRYFVAIWQRILKINKKFQKELICLLSLQYLTILYHLYCLTTVNYVHWHHFCWRHHMATETASHILCACVAFAEFIFHRLGKHFYRMKRLWWDSII
jgi:hypothetical protein